MGHIGEHAFGVALAHLFARVQDELRRGLNRVAPHALQQLQEAVGVAYTRGDQT